jgi:hypothetical protein
LFAYTRTGLFANNVFSFYGLSYPDTSQCRMQRNLIEDLHLYGVPGIKKVNLTLSISYSLSISISF